MRVSIVWRDDTEIEEAINAECEIIECDDVTKVKDIRIFKDPANQDYPDQYCAMIMYEEKEEDD